MATKRIPLEQIRFDGGTQMRAGLDGDTVEDYREAYREGANMPPLVVFHDGSHFWLADGFHRWHALHGNQVDKAECDVRKGSQRDAAWYAAGANVDHGLRRTNEDKHRAVKFVLSDAEWSRMSNRQIADHVGVSDVFVGKVRGQVQTVCTSDGRVGKDGKKYPVAERIKPALPKHVLPVQDDPSEDGSDSKESATKRSKQERPAPDQDDSGAERPHGGPHQPKSDGDDWFCAKCLEPMFDCPEMNESKPAEPKSTIISRCEAFWSSLTQAERIIAAGWFHDQLG